MKTVRPVTWLGFGLGLIAVLLIGTVDPIITLVIGVAGMTVSIAALMTSK